jgi:hypothetical protein
MVGRLQRSGGRRRTPIVAAKQVKEKHNVAKMNRRSFVQASVATGFAAALVVRGGNLGRAQEATPAAGSDALVRVVHASPDAPAVDVYVDGTLALENLAFGSASDYVPLPAGEHQVQVAATGTEAAQAVIDAMVTLEAGKAYEVAAVGNVASIEPLVLEVDLSPLAEGKARVRAVHASPDAPAVDVAVTGGPVLFTNATFPAGTDYAEVDAATYDLEIRPTGTTDVALAVPGVAVEAGKIYDIFAIGLVGDGTLAALPLVADAMTGGMMGTPAASMARGV